MIKVIVNGGEPMDDCPLDWDKAKIWQDEANEKKEDFEPNWSWDCGFKLDFDGPLVSITSRFYPPKKQYGAGWDGNMNLQILGENIIQTELQCNTLEELKKKAEEIKEHWANIVKSHLNV